MEQKRTLKIVSPRKIHTIVVSAPSVSTMEIDEVRELIQSLIDSSNLPGGFI